MSAPSTRTAAGPRRGIATGASSSRVGASSSTRPGAGSPRETRAWTPSAVRSRARTASSTCSAASPRRLRWARRAKAGSTAMNDLARAPDFEQRERALDPRRSYIVQAPAGSGKTELLIQRYLALLGRVERPEEIAAITFTIKAAAEMRLRVFAALAAARSEPRPPAPHEARTWDLARAALVRNDALGWKLEESADRVRVQTIDALCASLTRQMPVVSRFGAHPEVIEDASLLFGEAARNLLATLEDETNVAAPAVGRLLWHLDNDAAQAEKLLAAMLAQRDHWIRTLRKSSDRKSLEATLDEVRRASVDQVHELWPPKVAAPRAGDIDGWIAFGKEQLTKEGKWRQKTLVPESERNEPLRISLRAVKDFPPAQYSKEH